MNNKDESKIQDDQTKFKRKFLKDKLKLMQTNILNDFDK